jgi:cytochrome c oxidase assembly protein subunit 15
VPADGVTWKLPEAISNTPLVTPRLARALAITSLVVLAMQVLLGGWTSTNYAAVACPDFPTCQQRWWPEADFQEGFVLWRGLGINYEGGVLDHPARVAVHFTHRLGALFTTFAVLLAAFIAWRSRLGTAVNAAAAGVVAALALQLLIGIYMVLGGFPLGLATAHNAGAAVLVLATSLLLWTLRKS